MNNFTLQYIRIKLGLKGEGMVQKNIQGCQICASFHWFNTYGTEFQVTVVRVIPTTRLNSTNTTIRNVLSYCF